MTGSAPAHHPPGRIRVGPAGWSYADWAGIVYPAHRPAEFHEAAFLAQYFDTIEVNTSFYQPLRPQTCHRWIERVAANPNFLFTAKLWQRFTHETGATAEDERSFRAGLDALAGAGRLGAVLLQFPFSFHNTAENRARLEDLVERFGAYPLVVEVRHGTWNDRGFFHWLHERGAGFCNIDQPVIGRSMKPSDRVTAPVGYIRLHGRRYDTWFSDDPATPPEERYNYLYSAEELEPWAERARHVAAHTRTTFVITNNHFQGKAVVNALELIHLLTGAKVDVPDPLRRHYPELNRIAREPEREPLLFPEP
ncbi:MAG TPA: DUF72 domain-containing protein [Candidatus Acidoferrales bacterium]|nr:DUF72 domain-containing protein [Candidatus Acidoferrales bacterium]